MNLLGARDGKQWRFMDSSLSDTEVAISAASVLDEYLKFSFLLKIGNALRKSQSDRIFKGTGPLSSFDARIRLASAIGVIDADMQHDVDIIREIRNDFAHAPSPRHFTDPDIKANCEKLRLSALARKQPATAREKYIAGCRMVLGHWTILVQRQMAEVRFVGMHLKEIIENAGAATEELKARIHQRSAPQPPE
jgi:DNA-binding MltR family transcriptional regulator